MAIDKLELLEQLNDSWQPTNTIAKKLKANWHVVFGMLCMLYADGYLENQEIRFTGNRKTMLWRKKQNG